MTRSLSTIPIITEKSSHPPEPYHKPSFQNTINTFSADLTEIKAFLSISFSPRRSTTIKTFLQSALASLSSDYNFDDLPRHEQIDYLLLRSHVKRLQHQAEAEEKKSRSAREIGLFGEWVDACIQFVETRHDVERQHGRQIATVFQNAAHGIDRLIRRLGADEIFSKNDGKVRFIMFWTIARFVELKGALDEAVGFYRGYDPVISWWVESPWKVLEEKLTSLRKVLEEKTGVDGSSSADDIVGDPIGREALLEELQAEWIAYTPEELVQMGEEDFEWCGREMEKASKALGFDSTKDALEHVRETFVEPGEQIYVVRDLADEAIEYMEKHDLITVPKVARDYWQTTMMTPARQKINPFFLGGERIVVSYPTNCMCHEDKLMSMRGNNAAFSRSTVHHELIPGHHLQFYYMDRYHTHRKLFETPFWIEGWAVYWEFKLWDRGFPSEIGQRWATNEAENRIGMLFWRMHRCARIIFSIKFHLGQMTPQQCIDMLVERVGHERATAEGEVRRSFAGEYPPLYQAGYMLGAFQIQELWREFVVDLEGPRWSEKSFNDAVLRENNVPIELLRALFKGEKLSVDRRAVWKFSH